MRHHRMLGERLLRVALLCHPKAFRREYGAEMLEYYRESCRQVLPSRGRAWQARFLLASIAAAVREGLRQRHRTWSGRAAPPAGRPPHRHERRGARRRLTGGLGYDIRSSWRRLTEEPVTGLAIGMLALAVGLGAATFTVVDALMLRPAPFPHAERLAHVFAGDERGGRTTVPMELFAAWRSSAAFDDVQGVMHASAIVEDGAEPVMRVGAYVSPGLLEMLGAVPVLGRTFAAGEGRPGTRDRVMLSERLWRTQFGADRAVIGRRIRLSGTLHEVVGIVPDGFRFPTMRTELWRPMDFAALQPGAEQALNRPQVYARLRARMPREDARRLATAVVRSTTTRPGDQFAHFRPLAAGLLDAYSTAAVTLLTAGVTLVFLVLCGNVTSLVLARAMMRRQEYSVRSALGASRARLLRHTLVETAMLGLASAAAGGAVAWSLVSVAAAYLPDTFLLRTLNPLDLDARALGMTGALALAATSLAGIPPAWHGARVASTTSLRGSGRDGGPSRGQQAVLRGLIVGEVGFAVALLICGGLLVRSFVHLVHADRGLDARGVVTASMTLPRHHFTDATSMLAFADAVERTLAGMPGVDSVALSYGLPPRGSTRYIGPVTAVGEGGPEASAFLSGYFVGPGFFSLYGMTLLEGRALRDGDADHDVVITETLRHRLWPTQAAVGRAFRLEGEPDAFRVLGVVNDLRAPSAGVADDQLEWYRPLRVPAGGGLEATMFSTGQVMAGVRCQAACPPLAAIRDRVHALNPHVVISDLGPLEQDYRELVAGPRAAAALAMSFAFAAGLAAGGGLFSVLACAVTRRRRELGVRAALGAQPRDLARLVLREGLGLGAAGLAAGAVLAWLLSRLLASMLVGVTAADPISWTAVLAVTAAIVIGAALLPARRASSINPVRLLSE